MDGCSLCPRRCGADRSEINGRCGVGSRLKVARAALHHWEEPCISGQRGSGTVFFSGCSLGCVYCQNREISRGRAGAEISVRRLAEIFLELQDKGAHNINLVTPDHFAPAVAQALVEAKGSGLEVPVAVNTSGYLSEEIFRLLSPHTDIWLTDFKYMSSLRAWRYSGARDYPEVALRALDWMVGSAPRPEYGGDGLMRRGIIVRHLLLPGGLADSKQAVRYLHGRYGGSIVLSLMSQYTPMPGVGERFPELGRRVTREEYRELVDFALESGVESAYTQQLSAAEESFIPPFDLEGVLGG